MIGNQTQCRMCSSTNLESWIDLGHQPPSDAFMTETELKDKITLYPLAVNLCKDCGLSQLTYVVDPVELYQKDYPYESSTTEKGKKHYRNFANAVSNRFNVGQGDLVIDIGSNIGVLLDGFKDVGATILGIDPAQNIVDKANARGIKTICAFFNSLTAEVTNAFYGEAKVITGTNVFAHVDNLYDFMKGVNRLLDKDGVFIFESPALLSLVKNNAYSSIYHEHLSYLALSPVAKFVKKFGLEVFDVEEFDIHEGSFRVYIGREGKHPISDNVNTFIKKEEEAGILNINTLKDFGNRSLEHLRKIGELVRDLKTNSADTKAKLSNSVGQDVSIVLLSAPAKGMTIVNGLKWDRSIIDCATEKNPLKIGKFLPGTNIPVASDGYLIGERPDYAIIMAWNFQDEIIKNNRDYLEDGGKFIQLFPYIQVLTAEMLFGANQNV